MVHRGEKEKKKLPSAARACSRSVDRLVRAVTSGETTVDGTSRETRSRPLTTGVRGAATEKVAQAKVVKTARDEKYIV